MSRREITELYRSWRKRYKNHRPDRAVVRMYWEDENPNDTHRDIIALKPFDTGTNDDDGILFHANGLKGLLELTKPDNGSDFVVTEVLGFYRYAG